MLRREILLVRQANEAEVKSAVLEAEERQRDVYLHDAAALLIEHQNRQKAEAEEHGKKLEAYRSRMRAEVLKLNGELRALAKGPSSSGGARPSSSSGGASPKKKKQDKKQKKRQKKEQKKSLPAAMETEAKVSGSAPDAMALVRGALTGRCLLVSGSPRSGKSTLVAHALDKVGSCFVKAEGKLWRYEGPGDFVCHSLCLDTYWKREAIQYEEALEDVKQVRKKTPSAVIFMDGHQAIGSKILREEADLCIWIEATWEIRLARSKFKESGTQPSAGRMWMPSMRRSVFQLEAGWRRRAGSCSRQRLPWTRNKRTVKKEGAEEKEGWQEGAGEKCFAASNFKHIFCHASWLSSLLGGTGKGKRH